MKVIKKLNNSAVLALDAAEREVVVLGKGIGFPPVPYELTDFSKIDRTFYDVDNKYLAMIADLPKELLLVSADIAEEAELELDCTLNPNLPLTLADHLNYAVQRTRDGIQLTTPIAYDIRHLYAKEYGIGRQALSMLREQLGETLPETEAVNVALHLINAETENSDMHDFIKMMNIIDEVDKIVEKSLNFRMNKDGYNYSRFAAHMRYLIQRLQTDTQERNVVNSMKRTLMREYPDVYRCAFKVTEYFKVRWGWQCTDDEMVYLIMHIHRVRSREN